MKNKNNKKLRITIIFLVLAIVGIVITFNQFERNIWAGENAHYETLNIQTQKVNLKDEALLTATKLFGYIKYFHPSDEASSLDWDRFAVLLSQRVSQSDNLQNTLEEMFLPIAPSIQIHNKNKKPSSITQTSNPINLPDIYWQHIGNGEGGVRSVYKSARVNRKARFFSG